MYGEGVVFPALETLTLDFTDWALAADEGLKVRYFAFLAFSYQNL